MTFIEKILATLSDADDRAGVGQFLSLLRRVPGLRQWYRAVSLDTMARQRLDAYLDGKMTPLPNACAGRRLLKWLAGATAATEDEAADLKRYKIAPANFGGLSRSQIFALIRRYQAGRIDCASFLMMLAWRRELAGGAGGQVISPATAAATMQFLGEAVAGGRSRLFHHLALAAEFFDGQAIGAVKGAQFGHSAWWKLNLLGYMLHHPRPAYRTGEFERFLAGLKLAVDPADIRRFCRRHKIARDTRPGRPKRA
ncbi:hypothetical protein OH491_19095 [Termitidicoccus mucosus]|uniref:Uncharacterized protein n=1 Tax=Termitidicoccus mucosus TaxID=1184151 RepID=A0A178IJG7_9BACT|nr:hypothetical protein AW736_09530 [Opitutaceae bacterium TSB47]